MTAVGVPDPVVLVNEEVLQEETITIEFQRTRSLSCEYNMSGSPLDPMSDSPVISSWYLPGIPVSLEQFVLDLMSQSKLQTDY